MADPWGSSGSSAIAGFDPNIASSLIDEINQISVAFDSRYREIGTRLDGRDLRSKIEDLRRRATDATTRLRQVLSQNCSQQLMSKKQELVQQGSVALEKLHAAEQNVQRRTSDVVTVMRASISRTFLNKHMFIFDELMLSRICFDSNGPGRAVVVSLRTSFIFLIFHCRRSDSLRRIPSHLDHSMRCQSIQLLHLFRRTMKFRHCNGANDEILFWHLTFRF
jgi:hypothetical protein